MVYKVLLSSLFLLFVVVKSAPLPKDVPVPSFLDEAPKEIVASFQKMIGNAHNLTDEEIDKAVEEWVENQSDDIQSKWIEFQEDREKQEAKAAKHHIEAYQKFSPAAKEADDKLREIATHEELTAKEKFNKIQQVLRSLPKNVRHEIENALFAKKF